MREAIRRRKALQSAQSRRDETLLRKASESSQNFNSKRTGRGSNTTNFAQKRKALNSAKPGTTKKTFLKVSGHEIDTASGLLTNINSSPHIRNTQMRESLNDQAFYMSQGTSSWNNKNRLRQSCITDEKATSNEVLSNHEMTVGKYATGTEIFVNSAVPLSNPQSIETIDKVQSAVNLQSEVTL